MKRSTPMKRSPFSRNGVLAQTSFQRNRPRTKRSSLKRKPTKTTAIRQSARGQECTFKFECCNGNPETTVWCHSNNHQDGKGMGLKARDEEGCYGCSDCHAFYDGGYAETTTPRFLVEMVFDSAREISQVILRRLGLMK